MFCTRKASSILLRKSSFLSTPVYARPIAPTSSFHGRIVSRMTSTLPRLPIFEAIAKHDPDSTAVIHSQSGRRFTYGSLLKDVADAKHQLLEQAGKQRIDGKRIAFLVENSYDYVVTWLSIIGAHSIALPLSPAFPSHELRYIMDQSEASMLLSTPRYREKVQELLNEGLVAKPKHFTLAKKLEGGPTEKIELEDSGNGDGGMMLYTSGTTARPKGVLLPQAAMTAQARSLIKAWEYTPADHLLHALPLHHIHGTINAIFAPLLAGSIIEFTFPFNPAHVWERFAIPFIPSSKRKEKITFFTVVPTVYNRLLSTFSSLPQETQTAAKEAIKHENLRLCISGSAALPTPTKKKWTDLSSGNVLLERYGMTEVGMALSCGLPFPTRVDSSVGFPLPSVQVRLWDTDTNSVIQPGQELDPDGRERDGEIQLRGPTIFKEYWRNEKATKKEFMPGDDGKGDWFRTGDVAVRRVVESAGAGGESGRGWAQGPMYFIHGRLSADIIKSGGEKVSALEVERELLSLPQVSEAAVVAVPSGKWGQKVGAVVVLSQGTEKWSPLDMRRALRDRLANYKIPQIMKVVDEIKRNAMGKINKKELVKNVFADDASGDEAEQGQQK